MTADLLDLLTAWHRDEATAEPEARQYAQKLLTVLGRDGYTIVRTADLDLAERKAAHGCTDALCGDCDQ